MADKESSSASWPVAEALRMAEEQNVDLVEIAPLAEPPVCKLMDYGKFRYREQKKAHEAKLKQKQIQVKEIKFRPGTDEGDYKIKLGKLIQFLEEGDKAKVTLRFRGREMAHQEFGVRLLERVKADLEPYGAGGAVPEAGGPADGDGAGAEEEGRRSRQAKAARKRRKPKEARRSAAAELRRTRTSDVRGFKRPHGGPPGVRLKQKEQRLMPKMKIQEVAPPSASRSAAAAASSARRRYMRHILTKKSTKRKRQLRGTTEVHATNKRQRSAPCCRTRRKERAMPRVKRGVTARARHKKVLKQAKGFRGRRKNVYRVAKQAVMKAGQYAYRDRRNRKRTFRALWIARINAAVRELGMTLPRVHGGPEARQHRDRPQGARRPRGARQAGVRQDRQPGQSQP